VQTDLSTLLNQALTQLDYGQQPAALYDPIRYIMGLGGKRLRPLLTLLGGQLFIDDLALLVKPALATEVFHNFTLVHDDLMDQAPLRRGQPTVHEKWNASTAILSGDVMLVRAYELLFENVPAAVLPQVLRRFSQTAAEVCEGQQWDMNFETETTVTIAQYLDMIRLKTAVLLGFALELGAVLAGASADDAEHLRQFGDIIADKKTFLLLTAQAQADAAQKAALAQHIGQPVADDEAKVAAVRGVYDELEIRPQTEALINQYFEDALLHLARLSVPAARKEPLRRLALQLLERES
jgi:geranylgeranyl diphosphate synthase type II